jgi:hypothetical protein
MSLSGNGRKCLALRKVILVQIRVKEVVAYSVIKPHIREYRKDGRGDLDLREKILLFSILPFCLWLAVFIFCALTHLGV